MSSRAQICGLFLDYLIKFGSYKIHTTNFFLHRNPENLGRSIHCIDNTVTFAVRISNPRAFLVRALDAPAISCPDQLHLTSISPPAVDLSREGHPYFLVRARPSQMSEQIKVHVPSFFLNHVVRMHDKADQSIFLDNQIDLLL